MAVKVDEWAGESLAHWARHTSATETLRTVCAALGEAGIEALPVKGIVTAHLLYGDIARRPIADVDLRVRRRDFRALIRLARARGWAPRLHSPHLWEAVLTVDHWEVDVECSVSDPGLCSISIGEMMGRARRQVEPLGFSHLQPELHDHVLLLALNAFKDGLRPMPWAVEDLRRIVYQGDFRTDFLVERARAGGVLGALGIVADWLSREHEAERWQAIAAHVCEAARRRRIVKPYEFLRRRGWPERWAMFVTASSNDAAWRAAWGLALTLGGIGKGRIQRVLSAVERG